MSEQIHLKIVKVMEELDCGMFDATIELAERTGAEIETVIERLDDFTKQLLRRDALENNMIRKKDRPRPVNEIEFE